jgi:chromosome transmission fidelity protein 1
MRDITLSRIQDIEETTKQAGRHDACPYYSTRLAVPSCSIVAAPYQTLLHRTTRDALNLKLKGNIVVIDEAHNLPDTIIDMHSYLVSYRQLDAARVQLERYLERFEFKLSSRNLKYVRLLTRVTQQFCDFLAERAVSGGDVVPGLNSEEGENEKVSVMTINDFLFATGTFIQNMFKLDRYCRESDIIRKIGGYNERFPAVELHNNTEQTSNQPYESKHRPALGQVHHFMLALTNPDTDGRILVTRQRNSALLSRSTLKFLLFNPARHFKELVDEAHAVVLVGGTMQPVLRACFI